MILSHCRNDRFYIYLQFYNTAYNIIPMPLMYNRKLTFSLKINENTILEHYLYRILWQKIQYQGLRPQHIRYCTTSFVILTLYLTKNSIKFH